MKERLIVLFAEALPGVDFTKSEELVEDGILDSLGIVTVIDVISTEFNIEIPYEMLDAERFRSLAAIEEMIRELGGE